MSVCLDTGGVLSQPVNVSVAPSKPTEEAACATPIINVVNSTSPVENKTDHQVTNKSIAKLVVSAHPATTNSCNPVLQKVVNSPLITVLNSTGPLTVVKSLCVTSVVSSAPHYTLVNSSPLNVTNTAGKAPTITVLNCGSLSSPVTVVKAITTQSVEKTAADGHTSAPVISNSVSSTPAILENRGHNVFVKNTCSDSTVPDGVPQSHKLLTASHFPQPNVLSNINPSKPGTVNGQRNKLKILSNVVMPGTSQAQGNVLLNKTNTSQQRYNVPPRQKLIGTNGTTKYLNKAPNNVIKTNMTPSLKAVHEKSPTRMVYPMQKSQIKTLPSNSYVSKPPQGIKTLTPQHKTIPGQVQRTGTGLRTIPPQRPQKLANKPNYIGKHAVQAQKMRQSHSKLKNLKLPPSSAYNYHGPQVPEKQLTFNQALTAQIIETLSNSSAPVPTNRYEILPTRYDNAFTCPDNKQFTEPIKSPVQPLEDKTKSGLDVLSLICRAVLLDHNYNATLPSDSPTRPSPPISTQAQVNGLPPNSLYSPPICKRRSLPSSNTVSSTSLSNVSLGPGSSGSIIGSRDDDAASDISDCSERKHDTEGEETDTAPEAEAVTNEDQFDHYGDYVTRCICGFLHDDGYMVECDRCKVWQHVQCVVKNRRVPDEYLCEVCDPSKPIDRQKARLTQQQWLRDRQLLESKLRKEVKVKDNLKQKESISDTESSDGDHRVHNNNVIGKSRVLNRRKSEGAQKSRRDNSKEPVQKRQKRKERKIVKRKAKSQSKQQSHSDDENQDTWSSHLPQLRQWIEKYEEAVTNHYSPELRARISSIRVNGVHSDSSMQFDSDICKCRVHTQPLTEIKYLVTTAQLPPNTPVIELRGKYMLSTQHRNASVGSLTTRQHTQRPGPFLFFYRLQKDNTEVCVDTRTYGNSARFIRRSCKPNAELRHCIEKGVLHLYIVCIAEVDKNCELTIKHESHDLAVIGTTQIACACGNPDECSVNKGTIKKNGEGIEVLRKRRGRRTTSACLPSPEIPVKPVEKEESVGVPLSPPPMPERSPTPVKEEKVEVEELEVKTETKEEPMGVKVETKEEPEEPIKEKSVSVETKKDKLKEELKSPDITPIMTRRSSHYKSDKEDSGKEGKDVDLKEGKSKCKKLSREERKLEAILRAIEQMEKADQRKQEHQAKQAHRRESEPGPTSKDDDRQEPKVKRRRRKGRARTTSTNTSSRRTRLNSTDSYMTSGDENMLSPNDNLLPIRPSFKDSNEHSDNRAAGLLLALSNGDNLSKGEKTPPREIDSNSNSAHSSPETPQLSSACLLVQAAVEPLESGFKFPKTKKGLMNEWLNKVPEPVQSASSISPSSLVPHISPAVSCEESNSGFYGTPNKNLAALAQAASFCDSNVQSMGGNAKKRWLRQAISEDQSGDSPVGHPDSPPLSEMVAPPKKRRLPRESLSNDSTPPSTPTSVVPPVSALDDPKPPQECGVEIVYSAEGDSPTHTLESDLVLKERAAKMKQEFGRSVISSGDVPTKRVGGCLMDPRLAREHNVTSTLFSSSDHLVGTVEKTLSIFGFENKKVETPAKRKVKLSITEYRQRKKLNNNDRSDETEMEQDRVSIEENNSSESFKASMAMRARSCSESSSTSFTSEDEITSDVVVKAPAFNSEPTELERQREISSLRLKKAFGLAVDDETKKPTVALNVEAILNYELEPKAKPIALSSPTFPIPGVSEGSHISSAHPTSVPLDGPVGVLSPNPQNSPTVCQMEIENISVEEQKVSDENVVEEVKPNMFYTPDEEERVETVFEETESISYVPPFNNPVYPNSSYTVFSSSIDDDARYESRNPSPPPDLDSGTPDAPV